MNTSARKPGSYARVAKQFYVYLPGQHIPYYVKKSGLIHKAFCNIVERAALTGSRSFAVSKLYFTEPGLKPTEPLARRNATYLQTYYLALGFHGAVEPLGAIQTDRSREPAFEYDLLCILAPGSGINAFLLKVQEINASHGSTEK